MAFKHVSTKEELVSYLNQLNVATLSTCSSDGKPYAAIIYFIADHELNLYFLTLSETKKAQHLQKNNNVALTTIDLETLITIQTTGTVHEVTDPQQYTLLIKEISEANARKNKPHWPPPIAHIQNGGSIIVFKYKPTWLRVGDYSKKLPTSENVEESEVFKEFVS